MNYDKAWIFQDSVTTTGTGTLLYPNRNDNVTVYISGTSTSRTIAFEGQDTENNWFAIQGVRLSDYSKANSTTGTNEAWTIDLSGVVAFRANVTAIAGGTVRVTGKVVDSGHALAMATSSAIVGSLANNQTNKSAIANTNILTSNYTPSAYQNSKLVVGASASGVLSIVIDGVALTLNSGVVLVAGAAYSFDIPLLAGSTYNLKYSVNATMQVKWQVI